MSAAKIDFQEMASSPEDSGATYQPSKLEKEAVCEALESMKAGKVTAHEDARSELKKEFPYLKP